MWCFESKPLLGAVPVGSSSSSSSVILWNLGLRLTGSACTLVLYRLSCPHFVHTLAICIACSCNEEKYDAETWIYDCYFGYIITDMLVSSCLTRALVGSVYKSTWWAAIYCPSYLRNHWTNPQNSNGFRKPCQICRRKSNFIDLGVTDDVTGQVKDKMFCRSRVF